MKTLEGYTKESIFREVRKLIDTLNRFGNCVVPSIHEDGSNTSAVERLKWLIDRSKEEFGMSMEEIQEGVNAL